MWRMICFCFVLRRHKLRRANTISFRLRKETVCRLAAKPFPGLFHDGPPKARLRSGKTAFFCHRQRQYFRPKKGDQRKSPPDSSLKRGVQGQSQGHRYLSEAWIGHTAYRSSAE